MASKAGASSFFEKKYCTTLSAMIYYRSALQKSDTYYGALAQLGERIAGSVEVTT